MKMWTRIEGGYLKPTQSSITYHSAETISYTIKVMVKSDQCWS